MNSYSRCFSGGQLFAPAGTFLDAQQTVRQLGPVLARGQSVASNTALGPAHGEHPPLVHWRGLTMLLAPLGLQQVLPFAKSNVNHSKVAGHSSAPMGQQQRRVDVCCRGGGRPWAVWQAAGRRGAPGGVDGRVGLVVVAAASRGAPHVAANCDQLRRMCAPPGVLHMLPHQCLHRQQRFRSLQVALLNSPTSAWRGCQCSTVCSSLQ